MDHIKNINPYEIKKEKTKDKKVYWCLSDYQKKDLLREMLLRSSGYEDIILQEIMIYGLVYEKGDEVLNYNNKLDVDTYTMIYEGFLKGINSKHMIRPIKLLFHEYVTYVIENKIKNNKNKYKLRFPEPQKGSEDYKKWSEKLKLLGEQLSK